MFSCPTGTYKCNTDNSGSCKISLSDSMYTCGPNDFVVNSNTLGLNLSGAYCYAQPSSPNNFIACVPSLDKKTTSPDCKSGYTRCDGGGTNTCTVGKQYSASQLCSDNFGNAYSIKDITGTEIVGAMCHIDSNTACRPVSEDCGASGCKPNETCVSELTNVCKAPPVCNPPCENNAQCIEDPSNPGNTMCDCTTASLTTPIVDCFNTIFNPPERTIKPIFSGPTCAANLPDGFVLSSGSKNYTSGVVNPCESITNNLVCGDGLRHTADQYIYDCKKNNTECPPPNLYDISINGAAVCGKNNVGFSYTGLNNPDNTGCWLGEKNICDASTIPRATCDPPCADPKEICIADPMTSKPICFGYTIA